MTVKQSETTLWCKRKDPIRAVFAACLALVILILFLILLIWLILRPTSPQFTLQDVTVYQFKVTSPNYLTSSIQVTISSRNPNDRIGIYYDKLDIFATYRDQQITLPVFLLPTYEGHKDITVWSPFISGNSVPIAPYLATALNEDQNAGFVLVNIKVLGKLRWRVGTWISGHYGINVNCPAYMRFGNPGSGAKIVAGSKYTLSQTCTTDI
ncbi:NDR1/HIN1-like protein 1 [Macadamia integrifolia]|uniref:NDR1/HIN1-like protein 1 n=1 Tax=Macadamia integrifolia TaxID=60698 RepID=UPI001C532126|nr:NDR1/HIN1-like protein 1 [Macadamia integrifolia]